MEQNNGMNFDPQTGQPLDNGQDNTYTGTVVDDKFLGVGKDNWSVFCLILGIVSIVFAWLGYGAVIGVVAGIFGIMLSKKAKDAGLSNGQLTAGMVMSVIGIIGGAVIFVSCLACSGLAACASCLAA